MNKEDIIRMARESGMELYGLGKDREKFIFILERFAKTVAAAATEEANRRSNESWSLMCEKMVVAEREACAKVCEAQEDEGGEWDIQQQCANAIRARGQG